MTKIILGSLIAILSLLQYQLWFGESSIIKTIKLNRIYAEQFRINKALEEGNKELYLDYVNLKGSDLLIEQIARKDLGYIKKDEKYYKIAKR